MLNESAFADKGGGLRVALSGGIADKTLLAVATAFRNNVIRKFRMLAARLIAQTLAGDFDVVASVKYDGVGVFVYFDADRDLCFAFNAPSGGTRIGLECTEEAKRVLKARGHRRALLSAELYLRAGAARTRVSDVIHVTSNGTPEERSCLALAFYDAAMLDGQDLRANQRDYRKTWDLLATLFGTDETRACHRVAGQVMPATSVAAWFEHVTEEGLEGIVVRLLDSDTTFKIKPSLTVDTVAIGYVEGAFEGRYGVLSILCALCGPDGKTLQTVCRVGSGLTDEQRERLLDTLSPWKIDPPLRMADSEGRPITFICPGIVIEVEAEALRDAALDGTPVLNRTFRWDGANLHFVALSASPKLSHATFGCVREDKVWDDGGTRMTQVMSGSTAAAIIQPRLPVNADAQLFLREVYVKRPKNGGPVTAVRKIVVIERDDPRFPRFTVFYTDFSSGRKDPLKTELGIAQTPERRDELVVLYRGEAKKQGWALA